MDGKGEQCKEDYCQDRDDNPRYDEKGLFLLWFYNGRRPGHSLSLWMWFVCHSTGKDQIKWLKSCEGIPIGPYAHFPNRSPAELPGAIVIVQGFFIKKLALPYSFVLHPPPVYQEVIHCE